MEGWMDERMDIGLMDIGWMDIGSLVDAQFNRFQWVEKGPRLLA
jgi:hypothetical protein